MKFNGTNLRLLYDFLIFFKFYYLLFFYPFFVSDSHRIFPGFCPYKMQFSVQHSSSRKKWNIDFTSTFQYCFSKGFNFQLRWGGGHFSMRGTSFLNEGAPWRCLLRWRVSKGNACTPPPPSTRGKPGQCDLVAAPQWNIMDYIKLNLGFYSCKWHNCIQVCLKVNMYFD